MADLTAQLYEWAALFGESYRNEASLMTQAAAALKAAEEQYIAFYLIAPVDLGPNSGGMVSSSTRF